MSTSDRHYSSGLFVSAASGASDDCGFCADIAGVAMLPVEDDTPIYRHGFFLGQSMFTPKNLRLVNPKANDRPYAGWAFLGGRVYRETGNVLDTAQATIGIVGPESGAENTQAWWHSLQFVDGVKAQGWRAQLKTEPGIVLSGQRIWRVTVLNDPVGFEILPEANLSLGNIFTFAGAGLTLRLGTALNADWGPTRIAPGSEGSAFVDFNAVPDFAWNLFAGIEGRAVARNIFLDGNSFQDSPNVSKNALVGDFNAGLAVILLGKLRASVAYTQRTKEFRQQRNNDHFYSFALSYAY